MGIIHHTFITIGGTAPVLSGYIDDLLTKRQSKISFIHCIFWHLIEGVDVLASVLLTIMCCPNLLEVGVMLQPALIDRKWILIRSYQDKKSCNKPVLKDIM